MRIIDCEQGTPEWHAARCGRVTGSRIADIVRQTKSGPSKMRATYLGEIVAERLAGVQPSDGYVSASMQHGKDNEDAARETYAFVHGIDVVRVGFVLHPTIDGAGVSPDSLAGDSGLLEIKCPNTITHIQTLRGAPIDPDYAKQIQWGLACTGREWADFISYDPRLPADLAMKVIRVARDAAMIDFLENAVREFLADVDAEIDALMKLRQVAA